MSNKTACPSLPCTNHHNHSATLSISSFLFLIPDSFFFFSLSFFFWSVISLTRTYHFSAGTYGPQHKGSVSHLQIRLHHSTYIQKITTKMKCTLTPFVVLMYNLFFYNFSLYFGFGCLPGLKQSQTRPGLQAQLCPNPSP